MYNNYFGLSEAPFSIAPDPRFLYMSEQHREALAHLMYGVSSNGGFILLTGEVGTGKTTVSRCLLEQLPESTEVAFILNPKYSVRELLSAICDDLGISYSPASEMKEYVDALNQHLLENYRQSRHTVLIIDEAQNLSVDVLETIRLLTNLETNTHKLLQIILIGQPELLALLDRPELRQLNQRITARYHLRALRQEELAGYISHRLSIAGVECQLFPQATIKRLFQLTKGIPRLVNIVCDRALLGTYVQRENQVQSHTIGKAANEVFGGDAHDAEPSRGGLSKWVVAALLILALIGFGFTPPGQQLVDDLQARALPFIQSQPTSVEPVPPVSPAQVQPQPAEPVTAVPDTLSNPASWQWDNNTQAGLTQVMAYQDLLTLWGVEYDPRANPSVCRFADEQGLRCLSSVNSLEELARLNRPAVLSLFNPQGQKYFVTLTALNKDTAEVLLAGEKHIVRVDDLQLWLDGQFAVLWRKPEDYTGILQLGGTGPMVNWLELKLATLQGRAPLSEPPVIYEESLIRQVRRFQSSQGLIADGVVGPNTIIQINTLTDSSLPMLQKQAAGK